MNITQFIVDSGIWQCRVRSHLFPSILSLCKHSHFSILLCFFLSVSSVAFLSFYPFLSVSRIASLSFYPSLSLFKHCHFSILLSFSLSVSRITSLSLYLSLSLCKQFHLQYQAFYPSLSL